MISILEVIRSNCQYMRSSVHSVYSCPSTYAVPLAVLSRSLCWLGRGNGRRRRGRSRLCLTYAKLISVVIPADRLVTTNELLCVTVYVRGANEQQFRFMQITETRIEWRCIGCASPALSIAAVNVWTPVH